MKRKSAIIDIDGTLWNLWPEWYKELKKINPELPPIPNSWEFYEGYITFKSVMHSVKKIHMNQIRYGIFDKASYLTQFLRNNGYEVIIASHRVSASLPSTKKWLAKHNVEYDQLFCNLKISKHSLFSEEKTGMVIDDSPHTQIHSVSMGIPTFSIKREYNQHVDGVVFYPNFNDMVEGIETWVLKQPKV